ncbi:hypothetical protein GQ457_02G021690 [Hibiscus cannabinus]
MDFYLDSFEICFHENIRGVCNGQECYSDIVGYCRRVGDEVGAIQPPLTHVVDNRLASSPWHKLVEGWVRVNADGAVSGSDGRATIGGYFRDDSGEWLFGFSRSHGTCPVLVAEVWAAHDALMHS